MLSTRHAPAPVQPLRSKISAHSLLKSSRVVPFSMALVMALKTVSSSAPLAMPETAKALRKSKGDQSEACNIRSGAS